MTEKPKITTVKAIVEQYLKANGYDGLASDYCGCQLDDLAPCDNDFSHCRPADAHYCVYENCDECPCDTCAGPENWRESDTPRYMMVRDKELTDD